MGGAQSHRIKESELKAGDHIYTWRRSSFPYTHHGIYMGDDTVVHYTNTSNKSGFSSFSSSSSSPNAASCSACVALRSGRRTIGKGVIISCLKCFLDGGSLCRYRHGVSKEYANLSDRKGTCTTAQSDPAEVVMERALNSLAKGFGEYNLIANNCEDFAVFCKTGKSCWINVMEGNGGSQVNSWTSSIVSVGGPVRGFTEALSSWNIDTFK